MLCPYHVEVIGSLIRLDHVGDEESIRVAEHLYRQCCQTYRPRAEPGEVCP